MPDPANPLLDAARAWHDAGFCVIPSHEDGGKRPFGQWKKYQTQRPDWPTLEGWLQSGRYTGIGLIMGQASGNTEMLEIEGPANDLAGRLDDVVNQARKYDEIGASDLLSRVLHGFTEISAGGGLHTIIRITNGPALGNTKLAHDGNKVIAETRGEGGFVIVWPTAGRTGHEPGAAYILERGGPDTVAQVTSEDRDLLHEIFTHALDKTGPPAVELKPAPAPTPSTSSTGLSPLDDYAQRITWDEILQTAGWTYSHTDGNREHWTRPGKNKADGTSATSLEDGPLYVFTTSTDLPANEGMSKLYVYAHYHHGGGASFKK
jgi:hypothetical protein